MTEVWYVVRYGSDEDGWADTRYGDHFEELPDARRFVERYAAEFAARGDRLRIVKVTEEVIRTKHAIRWWAVVEGERIPRVATMRGTWGWDATCTCGWDSRTGGGVRRYVAELIADHRREQTD